MLMKPSVASSRNCSLSLRCVSKSFSEAMSRRSVCRRGRSSFGSQSAAAVSTIGHDPAGAHLALANMRDQITDAAECHQCGAQHRVLALASTGRCHLLAEDAMRHRLQLGFHLFQHIGLAIDDGLQQTRPGCARRRFVGVGLHLLFHETIEQPALREADRDQAFRRQDEADRDRTRVFSGRLTSGMLR